MRFSFSRGFTLVEVMITVGIIGILSAVAVPSYSLFVDQAKYGKARAEISSYVEMAMALRASQDDVLSGVTGNTCTACTITALGGWAAFGLQQVPLDPWGVEYRLDENENDLSPTDCRNDTILSSGKNKVIETNINITIDPAGGDDLLGAVPFFTDMHVGCAPRPRMSGGI